MKPTRTVHVSLLLCLALHVHARASTEEGSCLSAFELVNQQPKSSTYMQAVSSYSYTERASVFMLLSSG